MTSTFESTYPIFLQDKGVLPSEYTFTITQASQLLKNTFRPLKIANTIFFATFMLNLLLLLGGVAALVASSTLGYYYIGLPIFFCIFGWYMIFVLGFAVGLSVYRRRVVAAAKIALQSFFESENQRYYYSKGVQFKFSYDVTVVYGYKRNSVLFNPVVEIVLSQSYGNVQPQQSFQPQGYYYSQAAPVAQAPAYPQHQPQPQQAADYHYDYQTNMYQQQPNNNNNKY